MDTFGYRILPISESMKTCFGVKCMSGATMLWVILMLYGKGFVIYLAIGFVL